MFYKPDSTLLLQCKTSLRQYINEQYDSCELCFLLQKQDSRAPFCKLLYSTCLHKVLSNNMNQKTTILFESWYLMETSGKLTIQFICPFVLYGLRDYSVFFFYIPFCLSADIFGWTFQHYNLSSYLILMDIDLSCFSHCLNSQVESVSALMPIRYTLLHQCTLFDQTRDLIYLFNTDKLPFPGISWDCSF